MKLLILISMIFISTPSKAITWNEFWRPFTHNGGSYYNNYNTYNNYCYRTIYREQYIPGNRWSPGHVRSWRERVRVSCH